MTQDTYLARKGYDADFANITASGTLDVTGALNAGTESHTLTLTAGTVVLS